MASNGKFSNIPMPLAIMVISVVICIVFFVSLYVFNFGHFLSENTEVWGQFGDYIGGILNPFIAFTALLGLSYTILLQRKQMKQAEEDFKAQSAVQNEQLRHAAEAFQSQKLAQEKQAFESTFFQLMNVFSGVARDTNIKGMDNTSPSITTDTIGATTLLKQLRVCHTYLIDLHAYNNSPPSMLTAYDNGYKIFYSKNEFVVGHYFRVLYNIIKFIDHSDFDFQEKKFYTNLVRSQLSSIELSLLFYNGLSQYGREKFLPLINKYSLLKNLEGKDSGIGSYEEMIVRFLDVHSKIKS